MVLDNTEIKYFFTVLNFTEVEYLVFFFFPTFCFGVEDRFSPTLLKLPSKWWNVNVNVNKQQTLSLRPFVHPSHSHTTIDFSKSLLELLKTLFSFFTLQSTTSFLSHPELKNGHCSIFFLIYILCLSVSIFIIKIQFYSVCERVRVLAIFLFVCLKLLATHYYYSALPFKQVFRNSLIPTFISFSFFPWKIFFFIYIYISSLAWKFQHSWWELIFPCMALSWLALPKLIAHGPVLW